MFKDFDFKILNDLNFKEDSVREELIVPIIKKLGYSAHGDDKIIRSKSLIHPYVAIGSKQRKVSIVPDYLFLSDNEYYWVLDAKSPTEDILKSKHVEQAYSYAIHPEIRAKYYALCNGHEFILYSIDKFEPILHFKLTEIEENWNFLHRLLNPGIKANNQLMEYNLDFGMHLLKLGSDENFIYIGLATNSNFIAKISENNYTLTTLISGDTEYAASIDFDKSQYKTLLDLQSKEVSALISSSLEQQPFFILLENDEIKFGFTARVSSLTYENPEEVYAPLIVDKFMEYVDISEKITPELPR